MHILLADDDESIAMVARLGLRRAGFTVTVVDGARRRSGRRARPPSTRSSSTGTCPTWMASTSAGSCTPIRRGRVCRSSSSPAPRTTGAEQEALAAGARGVIFKPFDPMTWGAGQGAHRSRIAESEFRLHRISSAAAMHSEIRILNFLCDRRLQQPDAALVGVDLGLHAERHDELPVDVADLRPFPGGHVQRLQVVVQDVADRQ